MERAGSGISYMIEQMHKLGRPDPQFKEQGEIIVTFLRAPESGGGTASSPQPELWSTLPSAGNNLGTGGDSPNRMAGVDSTMEERQQLALHYVHEHGSITNRQYRAMTGVSENTALRDLDALVDKGSLRAIGKRRARQYRLP